MNLRQLGEDRLLQQLFVSLKPGQNVVSGPGDDCAAVRFGKDPKLLVLKTDCVVENVHFTPNADPRWIGWKAMMRPLSDFAAVSAIPQFALVTLIVPGKRLANWVGKIYRGLSAAAEKFDVSIVGGETSNTKGSATISVSVAGMVEKNRWVSRTGGRPGDDLFVTGRLGGSGAGKHLRFTPRIKESRWLTEHFSIHAMMDLSDGLGGDLPRLARASCVGFEIERSSLPLARGATVQGAIADGEDYELLFAVSSRDHGRIQRDWRKKFPKVPLTRIGNLTANPKHQTFLRRGYVHFT